MVKYRIWVRIDDCGDGSSSSSTFPTEEAARMGHFDGFDPDEPYPYALDEDDMDPHGYHVEITEDTFDTEGYEVIEA